MDFQSLHSRYLATLHPNDPCTSAHDFTTFIAFRMEDVIVEDGLDPLTLTDTQALAATDDLFNRDEWLFLLDVYRKETDV